jgi:hypothetical protein
MKKAKFGYKSFSRQQYQLIRRNTSCPADKKGLSANDAQSPDFVSYLGYYK